MCNLCGKHPSGPILCFKVNWKHPSFAAQMRWGGMSLRDDENSFSGLAIVCALVELHVNKTCHLSGRSAAPSYTVFTCRQGKKKKKKKEVWSNMMFVFQGDWHNHLFPGLLPHSGRPTWFYSWGQNSVYLYFAHILD